MIMMRSDHSGDGVLGGGGGRASVRKAHPIFKGPKSSKGTVSANSSRFGQWSLSICSFNFNDSNPHFRPPICSTLLGVTTIAGGVASFALMNRSLSITTGVAVTTTGTCILLFSLVWLFVTRQKIQRTIERKTAGITIENAESKLSTKASPNYPVDPIMNRGLSTIYYKGCEDTLPFGTGRLSEGTKSVRISPSNTFTCAESSRFQLMSAKRDEKRPNKHFEIIRSSTADSSTSSFQRLNKERTLPARPTLEKQRGASKGRTVSDHKISIAQKQSADTNTWKENLISSSTLPYSIRKSDWRVGFAEARTKPEQQPMLDQHPYIFEAAFQKNRQTT